MMLLVGGVVIAAIVVGAFFVVNNGSKGLPGSSGSPSASGSAGASGSQDAAGSPSESPVASPSAAFAGSLSFEPSTIGCPGQPFTATVVLPGSLAETDKITYKIDSTTIGTQTVADFGMTRNSDGNWSVTQPNPDGSANCSMGPGAHTASMLDSDGNVLAQSTFTFVTLATPTPRVTPKPTVAPKNSVVAKPSSFSCSAAAVDVTIAVRLSAAYAGSTTVSSELDGVKVQTATIASGFEKQSDGSWLSSATNTSTSLCEKFTIGPHHIGVWDINGKVIVEGTFTLKS
jgi:hypothetical protein